MWDKTLAIESESELGTELEQTSEQTLVLELEFESESALGIV